MMNMTWFWSSRIVIIFLLSGKLCSMRIGERLQFPVETKFGTFTTTYQQFAPKTSSSRLSVLSTASSLINPFMPINKQTESKPSILFIHGFGGNADQFRLNMPILANEGYSSYAIDLLGYGYGEKPDPKQYGVNELYNFNTWANQVEQFIDAKIQSPTILIANSVGGIAALVAAINRPEKIKGICLINTSLRLLHKKKQNAAQRVIVPVIQSLLRETSLGPWFFQQVATKDTLKKILSNAYALKDSEALDDEIVDLILKPGLDPQAAAVFLDFISYSGGPLPEELIPEVKCPVKFIWGENDPWEPVDLAYKTFASLPNVIDFVRLPGGGHCCMDQIPDAVNQEIRGFVEYLQRR